MTTEQHSEREGASAASEGPLNSGMQAILPEGAMIHSPSNGHGDSEPGGSEAITGRIPIEIDVAIPIRDFRVRKLLALAPGQVIATLWAEGEDMPLAARGAQLAWTEFEVIDQKLAVRITRLL
jgi:flagellar motor switch protein FliN/FliY